MGVYLPNTEMPPKGQMLVIFPDGTSYVCFNGMRERLAQTTAFSVPPHGRLIDADALKDYMIEALNEALPDCRSEKQRTELRETTLAFMQDIDECPTIIPASEETED